MERTFEGDERKKSKRRNRSYPCMRPIKNKEEKLNMINDEKQVRILNFQLFKSR